MTALLESLLGVFGGGFLMFLGAVVTGQLVPAGRVKDKDKELAAAYQRIATQQEVNERITDAWQTLKRENERAAEVAQITNTVVAAMKDFVGDQQARS